MLEKHIALRVIFEDIIVLNRAFKALLPENDA